MKLIAKLFPGGGKLAGWCGILAMGVIGCAPQYHSYSACGCASYRYCPPEPLPHEPYGGCPTPLAEQYPFEMITAQSAYKK